MPEPAGGARARVSVSFWQADGEQPVREVDFLVIGAGLVGCAAALFAANAGRHVTLTDARDLGLGASSRNAGFMITGLDSYYHRAIERYGHDVVREMWDLSEITHRHLHGVIDNAAGAVQRQRCGSLLLAESAEEARDLERAARAMDADGIDVQYHARDPLRRGYCAAIEQARDSAVQPYELVQALFRQSGAELVANNEVWRIEAGERGIVRVYSRRHRFEARHALVCANAWSGSLLPQLARHIAPVRAQILVTAPLRQGPLLHTCGYSDYGYMYYRDTFDGRLLLGGRPAAESLAGAQPPRRARQRPRAAHAGGLPAQALPGGGRAHRAALGGHHGLHLRRPAAGGPASPAWKTPASRSASTVMVCRWARARRSGPSICC